MYKSIISSCKKVQYVLLIAFTVTMSATLAQNSIQGTVTAEGQALPGVSIVVKGTSQGTTTDTEGKFTLAAVPAATLVFSYVGYQSREIMVGNQTNLTVNLLPDNQLLDEVIVIGYGQQSRRDITGSVSSVNQQVMKSVPRTNAATLLQGTAAGVRVQQSTGQPGATPRVILRGGTNFDGTGSPLYVVDGVIVPSLYGINPSDIESMDVLKDAASLAIYGARAGNGVVLVTTKKGKQGRTQVTYTYRNATNHVRRNGLQYLSAEDYIRYNRIGLKNRFLLAQADNNTSEMNNTRNQLNGSWGFAANSSFTQFQRPVFYPERNQCQPPVDRRPDVEPAGRPESLQPQSGRQPAVPRHVAAGTGRPDSATE